jgi:hypothetical protein
MLLHPLALCALAAVSARDVTISMIPPSVVNHHGGDTTKFTYTSAEFGSPVFNQNITGVLLYAPGTGKAGARDACKPIIPQTGWPTGPFIMVIDRGQCRFETKARHAQGAGAVAAIVINNGGNGRLPLIVPRIDEVTSDITIPMLLIANNVAAERTVSAMCALAHGCAPFGPAQFADVSMSLLWEQRTVSVGSVHDWWMWTTVDDVGNAAFKRQFAPVVQALGNAARFTPHFLLRSGAALGCDKKPDSSDCKSTCTNGGRYCAHDPDGDSFFGIDGTTIVRETLRQICVHQVRGRGWGWGMGVLQGGKASTPPPRLTIWFS